MSGTGDPGAPAAPTPWDVLVAIADHQVAVAAVWWDRIAAHRDCRTCTYAVWQRYGQAACRATPPAGNQLQRRWDPYRQLGLLRMGLPGSAEDPGWPSGPCAPPDFGSYGHLPHLARKGWAKAWRYLGCPHWQRVRTPCP